MKISLCLMVYDELGGCKIDVPQLPRDEFEEVYAVDGGSTDGTVEYLRSQGIPVYLQPRRGLNAAYVHAVKMSRCDAVVVFPPKGTISTSNVLKFRPLFKSGYQLIIASRDIRGGINEEDSKLLKPRKWCALCLALCASLIWRREGYFVRDVLHGFKGFTVAAFEKMAPLGYGISIDIEMVIKSYRLHLKRTEFPVTETSRIFGETHFKILPTGVGVFKYLWTEFNRRQ